MMKRNKILDLAVIYWSIVFFILIVFGFSKPKIVEVERQVEVVVVERKIAYMPLPPAFPTLTNTPTPHPTNTPTPLPEPFSGQSSFKSYENYENITRQSSPQYKLQQEAYTGDYGIRMIEDRYCVAMGSYWATEIGTKLDIYLESGELIKVILGDNKQDQHTQNNHRVGCNDRDVIEFIVDLSEIPHEVKNCGNFNKIFEGKVAAVILIEEE